MPLRPSSTLRRKPRLILSEPTAVRAGPHPSPLKYFDSTFQRDVVKIKPGEFFATTRPYIISTVLGSCVSACIRDTIRGGAGMNHFMLPQQTGLTPEQVSGSEALRYGSFAMESLINEFVRHGSQRRDLEAKVFGGAAVMELTHLDVGQLNASFVIDYLKVEGISTAAVDLGGLLPRRILQFVDTGTVLVKYLSRLTNRTIGTLEADYARDLGRSSREVNVELF